MARWFVNELSVTAEYEQANFIEDVGAVIARRQRSPDVRRSLLTSRSFLQWTPRTGVTLMSFIQAATGSQRKAILSWLASSGPFLDDERTEEEDDYFEYCGQDVTNCGLGEAARRIRRNVQAGSWSFPNGGDAFRAAAVNVVHGFSEEPFGEYEVPNLQSLDELERQIVLQSPLPASWEELFRVCAERYPKLRLGTGVGVGLRGETFYPYVAERTVELLGVLQRYMDDRQPNGSEGDVAKAIKAAHFVGEKAWFTDESSSNKNDFAAEMTFRDPVDESRKIFASWHGKIKTPQFRIHFEWPVPAGQEVLKVCYIGPKLTKR